MVSFVLQMLNKMLQGKLASTEATVRSQSEKIKNYRSLLEHAGLLPKSPKRSNSESNLSVMSTPGKGLSLARAYRRRSRSATSAEINKALNPPAELSPTSSVQGLNLAKFTTYGRSQDVRELQEQVAELKLKLANFDHVVRKQKAKIIQSTEDLNRSALDTNSTKEQLMKEVEALKLKLKAAGNAGTIPQGKGKSTSVKFLEKMVEVGY